MVKSTLIIHMTQKWHSHPQQISLTTVVDLQSGNTNWQTSINGQLMKELIKQSIGWFTSKMKLSNFHLLTGWKRGRYSMNFN